MRNRSSRRLFLIVLALLALAVSLPIPMAGAQDDATFPPSVIDIWPLPGVEIGLDEPLTITFDQPMNRESVEMAFVTDPLIPGELTWADARTLEFMPVIGWPGDETIRVSIGTTAESEAGASLRDAVVFDARTLGPLEVTSVSPQQDRSTGGAAADATIVVTFNRPVVPLTSTADQADLPSPITIAPTVEGSGEWVNSSMYVFTPAKPLAGSASYTVTVGAGLTATDGATLDEAYEWTFGTLPPQILSTTPALAQTGVLLDSPVTVTFSQPMDEASVEAAFQLTAAGASIPGAFDWNEDSTRVTFTPAEPLAIETRYVIQLAPSATTDTGATLAEGLSQPFSTVEYPRVIETRPANGQTDLRTDYFNARVTFNTRIDPETLRDRIVISPEPDTWRPEIYEWDRQNLQLTFAPAANTTYTVTIKAGVEDIYGNPTRDDYTFSFTTGALTEDFYPIINGNFMITGAYREDTRIGAMATGSGAYSVTLYDLDVDDLTTEAGLGFDDYFADYSDARYAFTSEIPPWASEDRILRYWEGGFDTGDEQKVPLEILLASEQGGQLEPGLYWVSLNSSIRSQWMGTHTFQFALAVATANVVVKRGPEESLIWVTDMQTAEPLPGTSVTVYKAGEAIATGTTDEEGVYVAPVELTAEDNIYVLAEGVGNGVSDGDANGSGGDVFGAWYSSYGVELPDQRGYLYTDRPLYRPGETVYYRGVLRARHDMDYVVPDIETVHVQVEHQWSDDVYWEGDVPVTDFGTFSGEFVIPEDVELGELMIVVDYGDNHYYAYGFENFMWGEEGNKSAILFTVSEFRPPEYEIEVTAPTTTAIQGDPLTFTGTATYYAGGAVTNAAVSYNIYAQQAVFDYEGPGRYLFSDETYGGGFYSEQIGYGEAQTDASGVLPLSVEDTTAPDAYPIRIAADITLSDESGLYVSGNASVIVHPASIYVGVRADSTFGATGDAMSVDLITVDTESEPVAGQAVEIEVSEVAWERTPIEGQFGRYEWTQRVTPVATDRVTTDAEGRATYSFTPSRAGSYRVRALTRDERERLHTASARLYVAGDSDVFWGASGDTVTLVSDSDTYRPGETARILIPISYTDGATVLLTAERAGVITHDVIKAEGTSLVYDLVIDEAFVPTVYVTATVISGIGEETPNPEYTTGSLTLNVEPVRQTLTIEAVPSSELNGPGNTVSFDLRATDADGNPARAEIGVNLTDESVLDLAEPNSPPLSEGFYGHQDNAVYTNVSLSGLLDVLTDGLFPAGRGGGGGGGGAGVYIRENFVFTPLWAPHVVTDENGEATVEVTLPDNLTTWQLDARAVTAATEVGQTTAEIISTLPLIVRPVTPRFMVAGDQVELAAVINNNTEAEQTVEATLDATGVTLADAPRQTVTIPAGNRARVAWTAMVENVDGVDLTFVAIGQDGAQDAAKPLLRTGPNDTIPVYAYSAPDTTGTGGVLSEAGAAQQAISLPTRYETVDGTLDVNLNPSLAAVTLDTLNYLERLSYDCIEQQISRFLPNVATYRAVTELGVDDAALETNLRTVIHDTYASLIANQRPDGSWGWCPEASEGDPLVTAYAALGLLEALETGILIDADALERALDFVGSRGVSANEGTPPYMLNRQAFYLYVQARGERLNRADVDALWSQRLKLSLAARAYLLMAVAEAFPDDETLQAPLMSDLTSAAILSATGAHWEEPVTDWYNWGSDTRTTALALNAILKVDPENPLLPNIVRWLMVARRGDHWQTTQETAWSVLALTDWMVLTGELNPDYEFSARINGEERAEATVTAQTVRDVTDLSIDVADLLADEPNRLTVARTEGEGNLYYSAFLNLQLPADQVDPLSRGFIVSREYYLDRDRSAPVTEAEVGDVLTVRVSLTLPDDQYYVVLDDPIPAGTEPVDNDLLNAPLDAANPRLAMRLQDDPYWFWGWWWFDRTELRDEKATLYADFLPRGTYVYTYQVRATIPGAFQVMPTEARAFYQPDVFGRGAGSTFTIAPSAVNEGIEAE